MQGHLHLMQGLPAGANTRPTGGVIGVFVRTKTLLAFTPKGMQVTEKCVTTFPFRFALFERARIVPTTCER